MRIVQVSQQDDGSGGFKAAYRLHRGLRAAGQDSRMLVLSKTTDDPAVEALIRPRLAAKIVWRLLGLANDFPLRRYPRTPTCGWTGSYLPAGAASRIRRLRPDVVQLHLFDCLLTYNAVNRLPGPVCWTLHDMGGITGGCHCTDLCTRYLERCGACPELGSAKLRDFSAWGWKAKHRAWQRPDLAAVCPSQWLTDEAARSPMCAGHRVVRIPNGLPLDVFRPERRAAARQRLGFHDERCYVLAGSSSLANPLKGYRFLVEMAARLAAQWPAAELVLFGRPGPPLQGVPNRQVGYVAREEEMADLYAACDVFVLPSLVDNLPNMLTESIACGTPCATFRVGGCPDVVRDHVTGFVAAEQTAEALLDAVGRVLSLDPPRRQALRASCRDVAMQEYSQELQARRYVSLYEEMRAGGADASVVR